MKKKYTRKNQINLTKITTRPVIIIFRFWIKRKNTRE